MLRSSRSFASVALVVAGVLVGGVAHAGSTLFSPVTSARSGADLQCIATNVGKKAQTMQVQLISFDGKTIFKDTTPVQVDTGASINGAADDPSEDLAYCKITAQGAKTTVRGAILVHDKVTGEILLEVPAQ